jgi:hypothetical protein
MMKAIVAGWSLLLRPAVPRRLLNDDIPGGQLDAFAVVDLEPQFALQHDRIVE